MSLFDCLETAVSAGDMDAARGRQVEAVYARLHGWYRESMGEAVAQAKAAMDTRRIMAAQLAEDRRRRLLEVAVSRRIDADQARFADPERPDLAVAALIDRDDRAPYASVETRRKALRGLYHARMDELLRRGRTRIGGRPGDPEWMARVVRESFGEATGDASAAAAAKALTDTADLARRNFNAAGGSVGTLDRWGMPQAHDSLKVRRVSEADWTREILPLLDLDRMKQRIATASSPTRRPPRPAPAPASTRRCAAARPHLARTGARSCDGSWRMTVQTTVHVWQHDGDGSTVEFDVPFRFLAAADLVVQLADGTGAVTTWALGSDYTVTGAGAASGGLITAAVAPAAGTKLTIERTTDRRQFSNYLEQDGFPKATIENDQDRRAMVDQELGGKLDRTLRIPVTDDLSVGLEYPPVITRRNMLSGFGAAGAVAVSGYATLGAVDGLVSAAYAAQAGLATPALLSSVSELRAINVPIGAAVNLAGYSGPGTPGGGLFRADPADTVSPDDGGLVVVDATGLRWKRQIDRKTVQMCGCLGDGTTVETDALVAALTAGPVAADSGTFLCAAQIDLSDATDVEFGPDARIKLNFQADHAILASGMAGAKISLNVEGNDTDPSGVRDCIRITGAVGCKLRFRIRDSHDVAVRLIDCDDCDIEIDAAFTSFRGYALIMDGCNNCYAKVRGRHTNIGVLITGPYLDADQSLSSRKGVLLSEYTGGAVVQAMIDDHDAMAVDVNGAINTTVVDSVASNWAKTAYNSNGDAVVASFQVKGGHVTRGNRFINCTAINCGHGFASVGSGSCEVVNLLVDGADWAPVLLTTTAMDISVRGLRATDWGKNPNSLASYAGLAWAPLIQVQNAVNCEFDGCRGEILTATPKKVGGIGIVTGTYNSFGNVGLAVFDATPELTYGIYDAGAFNNYEEGCADIFRPTSGGATKVWATKPVHIATLANAALPALCSAVVDSADAARQPFTPVQKSRLIVCASFTQTRAFGATDPGTIIMGIRTDNDAILESTAVPSSAYLNMAFVECIQVSVTTGIEYTYTLGGDTDGQFVITVYGFPL